MNAILGVLLILLVLVVFDIVLWKLFYRHYIKYNEKVWAQIDSNLAVATVNIALTVVFIVMGLAIRISRS